jgi:hypothetical protein
VCPVHKRSQPEATQRPSSSRYSRIKEVISVKPPRNSACTGIRYGERSEIWILTSARHKHRGNGDHCDRSFQWRRRDDGQRSFIPMRGRSARPAGRKGRRIPSGRAPKHLTATCFNFNLT